MSFVVAVTDPGAKGYIDPADRIAVFDNDGTLWTEKPLYFHGRGYEARLAGDLSARKICDSSTELDLSPIHHPHGG